MIVPFAPPLQPAVHMTSVLLSQVVDSSGARAYGAVDAPPYLLPLCAVTCYCLPILILYSSGQLGADRFHRELSGISLQERAVSDFVAWLERIGVLAPNRKKAMVDPMSRSGLAISMKAVSASEPDEEQTVDAPARVESLGWKSGQGKMRL
jgi:hypothetical protein